MKTIKIFIASSNELEKERLLMASLANDLSTKLEKVGIQVIAVEWENLDASMGAPHKQEEYNEKLRECDMCMVLYWTKFGMYTKTELDTAYNEKIAGKNPQKLWVYFKEIDDPSKLPTEELKEFRDSFPTKYGHFYTPFANFDTLKAHFLLQFMEYQSQALQGKSIVEVKDGKVTIEGKEYVDLQNVPFAGNNEEYNATKKSISDKRNLLQFVPSDNPLYAQTLEELDQLQEKLDKMESSLWDTALMITKLSTSKCSERLQRAMDLFSKGDNKGAQAILNEEEISKDVEHNLNLIKLGEEGKKGLKTNIYEYLLKIQTYENEMDEGWVEKTISLYKTCLTIGRARIDDEDLAEIVTDYADFLSEQNQYEKVEDLYGEAYFLFKKVGYKQRESYCLKELSNYYITSNNYQKAEETLNKYLSLQNSDGDEYEKYRYAWGKSILANLYYNQLKYEKALQECEEAISIITETKVNDSICDFLYLRGIIHKQLGKIDLAEQDAREIIDLTLRNDYNHNLSNAYHLLGIVYCNNNKYDLAIESYQKALTILEEKSQNNPQPYLQRIAITHLNIADNYRFTNKYKLAYEELFKARDIMRVLFKQSPLQNAEFYEKCLHTLANYCRSEINYKEAEEAINEAITACRLLAETDAERHLFDLAHSLNVKGIILYEQAKYKESEDCFLESLTIRKKLVLDFGEKYTERVAQILSNLGLLYIDMKEYEKAEKDNLEAINLYKKLKTDYGYNYDEDIARILLNQGYLNRIRKNWEKAIVFYQESVSIYKKVIQESPDKKLLFTYQCLSRCLCGMGMAQHKLKQLGDATKLYNESICIIEEQINDENYKVLSADYASPLNQKAWLLYENKEYSGAEPFAIKAVETIKLLSDNKNNLRMYLDTLACIHRELGKYEEAEKEFIECLGIAEELYTQNPKFNLPGLCNELKEISFLYYRIKDVDKFNQYKSKAIHYYNELNGESKKEREEDYKKLESMSL